MKRKPEEIIAFAERQAEARHQLCWFVPAFGVTILVSAFLLVRMLLEKETRLQQSLISDERFLLGFAFAMLFMMIIGLGAAMLATTLRRINGIEAEAIDLLLNLWKNKNGQPSSGV